MKKLTAAFLVVFLVGCWQQGSSGQSKKDSETVEAQQAQYSASQPVPVYNWSLERDLTIQLYNARNSKVATHSVWRSMTGKIEGHCPSMGFGLPYDTSLTSPTRNE